jgi:hypothetical protein
MADPKRKSRIPLFESAEDEAEFWDTHDSTEFEEEYEDVEMEFVQPLQSSLLIEMDDIEIEALAAAARRHHLGLAALAREWLIERLRAEEAREHAG